MKFVNFAEKWLKQKRDEIKPVSLTTYQRLIQIHIVPFLGDYQVDEIDKEVLEKFVDYLDNLEIGDITKENVLSLVNNMLYPKKRLSKKSNRKEVYLTKKELRQLVSYLKLNFSRKNTLILLAVLTGIGPGELCGIRGKDINFVHNCICINTIVSRINASSFETSKTKLQETESTHKRMICFPEWFLKYLKKITSADTFFITTGNKSMGDPRSLQYGLEKVSEELGFHVTFKKLQSTFIVNCLENGATLNEIAEFLGTTQHKLEKRGYKEKISDKRILRFQESIEKP